MTVGENISRATDMVRAAAVLVRRGMVQPTRPRDVLGAARALRRFGTFGGLAHYTAARYGPRQALSDENIQLSFGEVDEQSNARARALANLGGAGTVADERSREVPTVVGLLRRSSVDFVLDLAAANKAGVRTVLLNVGFAAPQLADVCTRERVTAVLADDEFAPLLNELDPGIVQVVGSGMAELAAGRSVSAPAPPARPGGLVLLTSGTTGAPKGAPRERISPLQSAQLLDRIPWPRDSAYVVAAPLFHATGLATCSLGLALGNRVVLRRRFDPRDTLQAIHVHHARALVVVPTMLSRILDLPPDVLQSFDTSCLEVVFTAGSSLSPELYRRATRLFGEVVYNLYGSTEVATAAVATPAELRRAPGTVGRPPVGCTIAAYDDRDRRITDPGTVGTVYVSSGLSFGGYTDGRHKKSLDGLLSSGDTGHFDDEGLWFIDGRDDEMVVCGGENVYPLEVENVLAEVPGVREVAVIGVPDPDFGMCLRAFIVRSDAVGAAAAPDADRIRSAVRSRLARHKVPRDVVFLEALPRNETGKVVKRALVDMEKS